MSIVHKYQFRGGMATMPLHEISALLTSTFQIGGSSTNTSALNHLGIPAGLVLSNVKELYDTAHEEHVATLPEDMFDRMLALVSPDGHVHRPTDGHVHRPVLTPRKKHSNIKTRRL
jgi:hypothetical protein